MRMGSRSGHECVQAKGRASFSSLSHFGALDLPFWDSLARLLFVLFFVAFSGGLGWRDPIPGVLFHSFFSCDPRTNQVDCNGACGAVALLFHRSVLATLLPFLERCVLVVTPTSFLPHLTTNLPPFLFSTHPRRQASSQPLDWLMEAFKKERGLKTPLLSRPALFQHIGRSSSLANKTQDCFAVNFAKPTG